MAPTSTSFGRRLRAASDAHGPLCVGIDPHEALLRDWGLPLDAAGVREFGLRTVDAAASRVGVVKPQVSFFERWGSAGLAALEEVLAAARAAGLVVIADAKRGDIGTTMDAYAAAWLTPGSPLEADAVTVSPYLGVGALTSTFQLALEHGKGVFVLAATSNPEARALQRAIVHAGAPVPPFPSDGPADPSALPQTVAHHVIQETSAWARPRTAAGDWSSLGFVIGATVDRHERGLPDVLWPPAPILAPGFGAQGAEPADLDRVFGRLAATVIASESRSILSAGPDGLAARIGERAGLYRGKSHG
ncbi:orotidine-5'-phosphate decarboxylase [Microbacterium sp.]|uniref:orotidine-5'-phosphate decarboxylase n=1 Tax=Microbacterium sp. TaxID=51671 RepID=UPI0039E36BB7